MHISHICTHTLNQTSVEDEFYLGSTQRCRRNLHTNTYIKLKLCFFAHVQAPSKISADIADVKALEDELRRVTGACARVWDERERERLYIYSSRYLCVYIYIYVHMYITYMCVYM